MLKKALILILVVCLYSGYVDKKNIEYTNTITHNIQEDIFYKIKSLGNYISTNIINEETKFYSTEALKNLFNAGKTIVSNISGSLLDATFNKNQDNIITSQDF